MKNISKVDFLKNSFSKKDFVNTKILCEKFLESGDLNFEVLEIYALTLYHLNDLEKSLEQFILLSERNSNHPTAHLNIARIYKSLNKIENAKKNYELAMNYYPVLENLYNEYANFLNQIHEKDECEKYLIKAIKTNKNYPITYFNLSKFYLEQFDYSGSSLFLERLIQFNPKDPVMLFEICKIYFELQQFEKAKHILIKLINIDYKNIKYYHSLIYIYLIQNNKKDLRECVYRAKKIFKDDPKVIYYESIIGDLDLKNYNFQILIDKFKLENNLSGQFYLNYSLFKFYEKKKDYANASSYLKKANKIKRSEFKQYNFLKHISQYIEISEYFEKNFNVLREKSSNNEFSPIFIIGMPRSGSTLIEQVVCSHSKVYGSGEVPFFSNSYEYFLNQDYTTQDFLQKISELSKKQISKIADFYIKQTSFFNKDRKIFFTDKMLLNFKILPLIKICFPQAKIIHCIRDPLDNCISILKNNFEDSFLPWAYDENELLDFYKTYKKVMIKYKQVLKIDIYEVDYEHFVTDNKNQIKKLLDYLSLDHENSCFDFFNNKREILTASTFQVREKIYDSSIKSYKSYENYFPEFIKNIKEI